MPRRDWSREEFDAFWSVTETVNQACGVAGCYKLSFACFDDGFAHITPYCRAHAEDTIRSGRSGADELARWRLFPRV